MANCELHIYNTKITPDKNALIEDIDAYLSNNAEEMYSAPDFQYLKLEINTSIKIDLDETMSSQN